MLKSDARTEVAQLSAALLEWRPVAATSLCAPRRQEINLCPLRVRPVDDAARGGAWSRQKGGVDPELPG